MLLTGHPLLSDGDTSPASGAVFPVVGKKETKAGTGDIFRADKTEWRACREKRPIDRGGLGGYNDPAAAGTAGL